MSCSVRIQTGSAEPIEVFVLDVTGDPLTGLSDVKVFLRRVSDNEYLDWSDDSFKPAPVSLYETLSEVDPVRSPGQYQLDTVNHPKGVNFSAITGLTMDDTYEVTVIQDPVNDAANLPKVGEIKVGQYVDDIPDFDAFERAEIKEVLGVTGTGTPSQFPLGGPLRLLLGMMQDNFFLDSTTYNAAGLLTSGRIRIFPTKTAADSATDGGAGEGEIASFTVTSVPEVSPLDALPKTYKVTRDP